MIWQLNEVPPQPPQPSFPNLDNHPSFVQAQPSTAAPQGAGAPAPPDSSGMPSQSPPPEKKGIHPAILAVIAAVAIMGLLFLLLMGSMMGIALLGFFPGVAGDAKATQSAAYWRGEARPFAILEHSQSGSLITIIAQNLETNSLKIGSIKLEGTAGQKGSYGGSDDAALSAGERHTYRVQLSNPCTAGTNYEYFVTVSYSDPADEGAKSMKGAKTLVGKCS